MAITTIPALDRTSATFRTDVDTFFGSQLPAFAAEANALATDVNAKQATASSAATTASTKAGEASTSAGTASTKAGEAAASAATASTKAGEASSAATTASTKAGEAAASAASIARDVPGGVAGLTLLKLNLRNAANTVTSWFTTAATVARTWTLPDKDGTIAMTSDITGTNSGINTGDETLATIKTKLGVTTLSGANTGDQTAASVSNTPAGGITAVTVQAALNELDTEKVAVSSKDATGGFAGLTLFKINFKNAANTFTSFFTNTATAARTYTFPDKDGTIAMTSDITGTNSGTNTGDETLATIKTKLGITTLSGSNTGDQTAASVSNTPAGGITAATVQAALNELDTEKARVGANSDITSLTNLTGGALVNGPASLGYSTGSGGTVTQATSKTTSVTLNKPTGRITMNAEALAAGAETGFAFNNSLLTSADSIIFTYVGPYTGNRRYEIWTVGGINSSINVFIKNITAGSLSDAVAFNFAILRGATA